MPALQAVAKQLFGYCRRNQPVARFADVTPVNEYRRFFVKKYLAQVCEPRSTDPLTQVRLNQGCGGGEKIPQFRLLGEFSLLIKAELRLLKYGRLPEKPCFEAKLLGETIDDAEISLVATQYLRSKSLCCGAAPGGERLCNC